jgi:hypothetical protein
MPALGVAKRHAASHSHKYPAGVSHPAPPLTPAARAASASVRPGPPHRSRASRYHRFGPGGVQQGHRRASPACRSIRSTMNSRAPAAAATRVCRARQVWSGSVM